MNKKELQAIAQAALEALKSAACRIYLLANRPQNLAASSNPSLPYMF